MAALTRINATIPQTLGEFAEQRVQSGSFGNKSEYIRHLIRQDREATRQNQIDYFNARIEKSLASGISNRTPAQIKQQMEASIANATSNN